MPDRTLVIHGGFAKTGTSALQVGFARNRDWLLAQGIDYPRTGHFDVGMQGAIGSGNAYELAVHVCRLEDRPEAMAALPALLQASPGRIVLLSSEFFQRADRQALTEFVAAARGAGFRVRAVFLVRAYYDWLWSAYVQNVKNHAVSIGFAEWVPAAGLEHLFAETTALFDEVLGPDDVTVVNFDAIRDDVLAGFLRLVFGVQVPPDAVQRPAEINRSLTAGELSLLRRFNAVHASEEDGTALSNLLIEASPGETAATGMDSAVLRWLAGAVEGDLAQLNARVLGAPVRLAANPAAGMGGGGRDAQRALETLALQTFALLLDTRRQLAALQSARAAPAPAPASSAAPPASPASAAIAPAASSAAVAHAATDAAGGGEA